MKKFCTDPSMPDPCPLASNASGNTKRGQPVPTSSLAPGVVLPLTDSDIWSFVKHGHRTPPLTILVRQLGGADREIPLTDVARVMWSPRDMPVPLD